MNVDGKQTDRSVGLELIVKSETVDEILDALIQKQLLSVFYGSPERYFDYVESVLSIKIEKELRTSFTEIKASRDIIVHNSGIANAVYVSKAGKEARGRAGERLKADAAYFKRAIHTMKKLTHSVYSKTLQKFGDHLPKNKRK